MMDYESETEVMSLLFLVYMDALYIVSSYVDIDFNCKYMKLTLLSMIVFAIRLFRV